MTVQQIVAILNEAVAADPIAMRKLVRGSVSANEALASHPRIVCWASDEVNSGGAVANWFGILIGIASLDGQSIEANWSEDLETLIGFSVINHSVENELIRMLSRTAQVKLRGTAEANQ